MRISISSLTRSTLLTFAIIFTASSLFAVDWKPISDAELLLKSPIVDKDADAEAIFWEVKVFDEFKGQDFQTSQMHYIRIKVFNERGRERAKVEVVYTDRQNISGIAGRTIKPDGTVVELKKDAIFNKDVVKGKGVKVRTRSFTLPDVQPGDIIEYQWRQTTQNQVSNYLRLYLQRDIPIHSVRYLVKPLSVSWLPSSMRSMSFHAPDKTFKQERGYEGYSVVEYNNMPAFKREPYMPPDDEIRAWLLIFYAPDTERKADKYWPKYGREQYAKFKELIKISGEMKKVAAEATAGAENENEKAKALYAWVRKNIKNTYNAATTAAERADFKPNRTTGDTLKQGIGTGRDLNLLFAGLATSAGLEARMALTGDRSDLFFRPDIADSYFLGAEEVAIQIDGKWKFFDASSRYLAAGQVSWREQGGKVLVTDGKQPQWVDSPVNDPTQATERHTGRMKLSLDGSLEGDLSMIYGGHEATDVRARFTPMNPAEREQALREDMKARFPECEVSDIRWDALENPDSEFMISFKIRIPEVVQRTGKRMFLQPALFHKSNSALFSSATRKYPVYFEHPWSEMDFFDIELPEGYELDHPDIPGAMKVGEVVNYKLTAQVSTTKSPTAVVNRLIYKRELSFNGVNFPVTAYADLKQIFDRIRSGDQHALSIRQPTPGDKAAAKTGDKQ